MTEVKSATKREKEIRGDESDPAYPGRTVGTIETEEDEIFRLTRDHMGLSYNLSQKRDDGSWFLVKRDNDARGNTEKSADEAAFDRAVGAVKRDNYQDIKTQEVA